jgi:hypothetical protein
VTNPASASVTNTSIETTSGRSFSVANSNTAMNKIIKTRAISKVTESSILKDFWAQGLPLEKQG